MNTCVDAQLSIYTKYYLKRYIVINEWHNCTPSSADDSAAFDDDPTISHDQDQLARGRSKSTGVSSASNHLKKKHTL